MYNNRSRGNRSEGRFGARRFGARSFGDRGPRTMFKAVCAVCGEPCEVPFRPSGSRPIYCDKHFEGKDEASSRRPASRGFDRPHGEDRQESSRATAQLMGELKSLNIKVDRILSALDSRQEKSKSVKLKTPNKEISQADIAIEDIVSEPPKSE